ncbi:hypothetical protein, partial [Allosphingosinicella sp.]|uniref:hypothetical protein n=1 Tax=Allosphingosinicella sp. TaxID=2823234 RepID=UPI002EE2DC05
IGVPVTSGQINNIYIRCKNISSSAMTGTVQLYYCNSSFLLTPASWNPVSTPGTAVTMVSVDQGSSTTIPPAADTETGIAIVQAPFQISGVPANAHYCFLSFANNKGIPVTVPVSFASNAALQYWFRQNPNISFRNIVIGVPNTATVITFHTFGNINPITNTMIITMTGTNLPANTTWGASCNDTRLSVPFSASGTFSSSGTAGTQLDVPAHLDGTTGNQLASMAFNFTNPAGGPFPSTSKVRIRMYQVPSPTPLDYEKEMTEVHRVPPADGRAADEDGLVESSLILLGAVDVWLSSPPVMDASDQMIEPAAIASADVCREQGA